MGKCHGCGATMTAKCGSLRVWHWAHQGRRNCDPWWENETEWHRAWKNRFPKDWQERSHQSENGEKHIADVKTDRGVVFEFQHSLLPPGERESRETFYQTMVWVVDGVRGKRDEPQFFRCVEAGTVINHEPPIVSLLWKEGSLLRDWGASNVPVYFDFQDSDIPILWRLNPPIRNGMTYLSPVLKSVFLAAHLKGLLFEAMASADVERAATRQQTPPPRPLRGFERYAAQRARKRRRF